MRRYSFPLFVTIVTLLICVMVAFDLVPAWRGPASTPASPVEWQWRYLYPPNIVAWKLILPLAAVGLMAAWAYLTRRRHIDLKWLVALAVLALAFRLAVQSSGNTNTMIVARTLNPAYFTYFEPATKITDLFDFLHNYETVRKTHYRMNTHPPGNTVFFWLIIRAVDAVPVVTAWAEPIIKPRIANLPDWRNLYTTSHFVAASIAAVLVPFLSALSVIPIYALAKIIWEERAARLAILIYAFIPALTVFTPVIDDAICLLASSSFYFIASGLQNKSWWRIGLAGFLVSVGSFMSFSVLPLFVMCGLMILVIHLPNWRISWQAIIRDGITLAMGSAILWIAVWLIFGLNPLAQSTSSVRNLDAERRAYLPSVFYGPIDIVMFAGIPLTIHSALALFHSVKQRPFSLARVMIIAFNFSLLMLFVAGSLRGEVARTILYVFPLMSVLGANDLKEKIERASLYQPLFFALMILQTIIFQSTLDAYH